MHDKRQEKLAEILTEWVEIVTDLTITVRTFGEETEIEMGEPEVWEGIRTEVKFSAKGRSVKVLYVGDSPAREWLDKLFAGVIFYLDLRRAPLCLIGDHQMPFFCPTNDARWS